MCSLGHVAAVEHDEYSESLAPLADEFEGLVCEVHDARHIQLSEEGTCPTDVLQSHVSHLQTHYAKNILSFETVSMAQAFRKPQL